MEDEELKRCVEDLYFVRYEYIDLIDPAPTEGNIEEYIDVVRAGHLEKFERVGKKRFNHFEILEVERCDNNDTLDWRLGSGYNITLPNKFIHSKQLRLDLK